ncbi:hypothetical protein [Moorena producens]
MQRGLGGFPHSRFASRQRQIKYIFLSPTPYTPPPTPHTSRLC